MIEDLFASLNALLGQHSHLLHTMQILFWIKSYLLLGIYGIFVYLAFTDPELNSVHHPRNEPKARSKGVLVA
ncbi:MAG: hypothetical protein FIA97_11730 [Methylococcaceae bacterium]|nr:hypothetical protein [Methylococcaceae bacterium]